MLSHFFGKNEKKITLFESLSELSSLQPLLTKLRARKDKLCAEVNNNLADPSFLKSHCLTQLTNQIDKIIADFNKVEHFNSNNERLLAIQSVTKLLKRCVDQFLSAYKDVLNIPRNYYKKYAANSVDIGAEAACWLTGYYTGSLSMVFFSGFGIHMANGQNQMKKALGVDDLRTESIILLSAISATLDSIVSVTDQLLGNELSDSSPLICPIMKTRMVHPVLCTLDGHLYEEKAIKEWLTQKRSSPMNRVALKQDQTPESVLVYSFALNNALEDMELSEQQKESTSSSSNSSLNKP